MNVIFAVIITTVVVGLASTFIVPMFWKPKQ